MIPGQLISPGQLTALGVNFASVHGLEPVTVHISFSFRFWHFQSVPLAPEIFKGR